MSKMTTKQAETIERLRERWGRIEVLGPLPCDDCIMVRCYPKGAAGPYPYENPDRLPYSICIGVETDGYAHS
jgi:hypothetical protein